MGLRMMLRCSCLALWSFSGIVGADSGSFGKVKGTVNFCSQGGLAGMQVYVPGRQLIVITADDGRFLFEFIPEGEYRLNYVYRSKLLNSHAGVKVYNGRENDLGEIAFCDTAIVVDATRLQNPGLSSLPNGAPMARHEVARSNECNTALASINCIDADNDGVVAGIDCEDNNALQRPGLVESCDGLDNNCNGVVDEMPSITIRNGVGSCVRGSVVVKSCVVGYADCDKDPSNGCEVDTMNDINHCGACGNECSSMDLCRLGSC